ncbi:transcription termination factor MTERF8, chloroplastic [Punica granatum]|uniref:Transcription termination factor MTERF8, chloroplastic n=2 Tax=Punica granatum TaxID=22663 RepID=A0A6P8CA74_PUNGR|nr:transcription termination factor MTERF8, chloroplastic [Punica granatum]PKI76431.1 hypothetical protein CRG98_003226 [Punica granatum]
MPTSCASPSPAPFSSYSSVHPPTSSLYSPLPWPSSGTSSPSRDRFFNLLKSSPLPRPQPSPLAAHPGSSLAKSSPARCSRSTSRPDPQANPLSGVFFTFFQELGLSEKESVLLLNRNQELRHVHVDSLRARVESLRSQGINGLDISCLVSKSPDVLTADETGSLLCVMRDELEGKISPAQLKRLLISTDPRFLAGFEQKVNLLFQYGVPKEKVVHILNNVNLAKAFCLKSIGEIDRLIDFLSDYGGVDLIIRRPLILNYHLNEQLIPRVEFLLRLSGGDRDTTACVIRKLPAILSYSVEHVEGHVEFFRSSAGLNDSEIFRIMLVFPNMISASKDRKLRPRIDFLKQCGLSSIEIFKLLIKAPLLLGLSFEDNLAYKLGFLVKIGYKFRTKELAVAMGAVTRTSSENLQKVVGLFLGYGFSCSDILAMSKKHHQILQYNPSSLEEKVEYLVGEMGREIEELLTFPAFLGYRLDSRIKHRYEAKKDIKGERMSLNKLLSVSVERFSAGTVKKIMKKC